MVGQQPAAELKPAVDPGQTFHAESDLELEISQVAALPHQVLVHFAGVLLGDFGGDRAVLDRPIAHVRHLPAFQRLAVEDALEARLVARSSNRQRGG